MQVDAKQLRFNSSVFQREAAGTLDIADGGIAPGHIVSGATSGSVPCIIDGAFSSGVPFLQESGVPLLILDFENNVNDGTGHHTTSGALTYSATYKAHGTYGATGTSASVSITSNLEHFNFNRKSFRLRFWVRATSSTSGRAYLKVYWDANNYIELGYYDRNLRAVVYESGTALSSISYAHSWTNDSWHAVDFIYDEATLRACVNGATIQSATITNTAWPWPGTSPTVTLELNSVYIDALMLSRGVKCGASKFVPELDLPNNGTQAFHANEIVLGTYALPMQSKIKAVPCVSSAAVDIHYKVVDSIITSHPLEIVGGMHWRDSFFNVDDSGSPTTIVSDSNWTLWTDASAPTLTGTGTSSNYNGNPGLRVAFPDATSSGASYTFELVGKGSYTIGREGTLLTLIANVIVPRTTNSGNNIWNGVDRSGTALTNSEFFIGFKVAAASGSGSETGFIITTTDTTPTWNLIVGAGTPVSTGMQNATGTGDYIRYQFILTLMPGGGGIGTVIQEKDGVVSQKTVASTSTVPSTTTVLKLAFYGSLAYSTTFNAEGAAIITGLEVLELPPVLSVA